MRQSTSNPQFELRGRTASPARTLHPTAANENCSHARCYGHRNDHLPVRLGPIFCAGHCDAPADWPSLALVTTVITQRIVETCVEINARRNREVERDRPNVPGPYRVQIPKADPPRAGGLRKCSRAGQQRKESRQQLRGGEGETKEVTLATAFSEKEGFARSTGAR